MQLENRRACASLWAKRFAEQDAYPQRKARNGARRVAATPSAASSTETLLLKPFLQIRQSLVARVAF
jgi:hypothetical protein